MVFEICTGPFISMLCLFVKVTRVARSELEEQPYMNLGELAAVDEVAFAYQIASGMVLQCMPCMSVCK